MKSDWRFLNHSSAAYKSNLVNPKNDTLMDAMKRNLIFLSLSLATATTFAQGLVNFQNPSVMLVSAGPAGAAQPIAGPSGSYYFALLLAPANQFPSLFSFSGVYGTNLSVAGMFSGGASVAVPGWQPDTFETVKVAGWSSDLGHDWNPEWLNGVFPGASKNSVFGLSLPGLGGTFANGKVGDIFGGNNIDDIGSGFDLLPIPEPSTVVLAALGAATLTLYRRSRRTNAQH